MVQTELSFGDSELINSVAEASCGLSPSGDVIFYSQGARALLRLPLSAAVQELPRHAPDTLATLEGFGRKLLQEKISRARLRSVEPELMIEETLISTCDGRQISVLLQGRKLKNHPQLGGLVVIHELARFAPVLALIEQSRRMRASIIYASALLRKPLAEIPLDALFSALNQAPVLPTTGSSSPFYYRDTASDLNQVVTTAVEIVDKLVPPSFRIVLESITPALVSLPDVPLIRLISHCFLEASDYAGPYGKARSSFFLRKSNSESKSVSQLIIFAERPDFNTLALGALDSYFAKHYMNSDYRVSETSSDLMVTPEEEALIERYLGREASQTVNLQASIPRTVYSENIRIAEAICSSLRTNGSRVNLSLKIISIKCLAIMLEVELV